MKNSPQIWKILKTAQTEPNDFNVWNRVSYTCTKFCVLYLKFPIISEKIENQMWKKSPLLYYSLKIRKKLFIFSKNLQISQERMKMRNEVHFWVFFLKKCSKNCVIPRQNCFIKVFINIILQKKKMHKANGHYTFIFDTTCSIQLDSCADLWWSSFEENFQWFL